MVTSRMCGRRIPVSRLGSRGPGGDQKSLRLWTQAFASVRKCSQAFASVRKRSATVRKRPQAFARVGHARKTQIVAKRRTVVTFYVWPCKRVYRHGIGEVVVAKRRTVVTFRLVWVQQSRGSGRSWSRNAELSSLFDSSGIVECNSHGDRGGRGRETQNCRRHVPKVSTVTGIGGVVVAKRRTVVTFVTFRLLCCRRVHKCQQSRGSGVSWSRNAELSSHSSRFDSSAVVASHSVNSHRDRGGRSRETQNCRHF